MSARSAIPISALRPEVAHALALPEGTNPSAQVCRACYAHARALVFREQLTSQRGALTDLESEIAKRAADHVAVARDLDASLDASATTADKLADRLAQVGGSWAFVLSFLTALVVWMLVNTLFLRTEAFDPYPYILLNLVLSCVAAIQAPIILMSQNRAASRDRAQAMQDYRVNLKAELEVAALHEKLDLLLHQKWETLADLQEAQTDLLEELLARTERSEHE